MKESSGNLSLWSGIIALASLLCVVAVLFRESSTPTSLVKEMTATVETLQNNNQAFQLSLQQQFSDLAKLQLDARRFEIGFATKQKHYSRFMAACVDAYLQMSRQEKKALEQTLLVLDKEYYALEPFLSETVRLQFRKQLTVFANLAVHAAQPWREKNKSFDAERKKADQLIEGFQGLLYPELFAQGRSDIASSDSAQVTGSIASKKPSE